jgi:tetratricopeptide (TPR) repeat protein
MDHERAAGEPLVTVIIPTRNRPDRLRDAVASVLAQTLQRFEIIVVNDAGAPVEDVVVDDPRVRMVRAAGQRCMAGARNLGLRLARGRYVAYLDDDDFFHPEHLQTLVDAMEGGRFKVAYSFARRLHEREEDGRRVTVGEDVPWRHEFDRDLLYATNYIPILCLMHERACLDEVGAFDESLGVLEDWDLWVRLARRWDFRCVPRVTCTFTWRGNTSSVTGERLKLFGYVGARVHRKHRDAVLLSPRALRTVGRMWLRSFSQQAELGALDEAIAGLERFSADAPLWADAQANLGVLYFAAGRLDEARAAAARAVAMDGSIPEARRNLASLELVRGRPDLALAAIAPRLADDPRDAEAMFIAAEALRAQGRERDARDAYELVVELAPDHAGARERLGSLAASAPRFASLGGR